MQNRRHFLGGNGVGIPAQRLQQFGIQSSGKLVNRCAKISNDGLRKFRLTVGGLSARTLAALNANFEFQNLGFRKRKGAGGMDRKLEMKTTAAVVGIRYKTGDSTVASTRS